MEYGEAEELLQLARREAEGHEEPMDPPEDEDDAAREELRALVGRRADPPTPAHLDTGIPADVSNLPTPEALQTLRGKCRYRT